MNKVRSLVIIIVSLAYLLISSFKHLEREPIKVTAFVSKKQKNTSLNTNVSVKIFNKSNKTLKMPGIRQIGVKNDPIADLIIELKKQINDFTYVSIDLSDEYLPTTEELILKEFHNKETITDTVNLAVYYKFPIGSYCGRLLYRASKYNNVEDVYSNWVKFSVTEVIPIKGIKPGL